MSGYFAWFGLPGSLVLTTLLSLFALMLAVIFGGTDRWICFAAMLLSSCGDIFLMNLDFIRSRFANYFVIGAAFFMISHLVYAAAFLRLSKQNAYPIGGSGVITALIVSAAALIIIGGLMLKNGPFTPSALILSLIYLAIITVNMACVFGFSFHAAADGHLWRLISAVGVLSFFVSDCIIGLDILCGIGSFGHLIWWFYPIGQFLLLIAA